MTNRRTAAIAGVALGALLGWLLTRPSASTPPESSPRTEPEAPRPSLEGLPRAGTPPPPVDPVPTPPVPEAPAAEPDPVLLVVDETSGAPLPGAVLEGGPAAPDAPPVHADAEGRIRVPRALVERLRRERGIVSERSHLPKFWDPFAERADQRPSGTEDDPSGATRIRLEPFPSDTPIPWRTLRLVREDGSALAGALVVIRTPIMQVLFLVSPIPARSDPTGLVEFAMPGVAAYDVYDGATLAGTFVAARAMTPEGRTREIHVPPLIRVHVVVRGLVEPKPTVWLHGPDVVSLEPDDLTGFARIDGVDQPGWKAFERGEGTAVQVSDGLPAEMDVWLPRGGSVRLDVEGRQAVLRAEEPTTIELDWSTLPPTPREGGNVSWSSTRERLDRAPGAEPTPATPK